MDWDPLVDYLQRTVVARMRRPERGTAWLNALRGCEDGERLAICMTIDVCVGSVDPAWFAEVLDALPAGFDDARMAFDEAMQPRMEAGELVAASHHGEPPLEEGDRYLRVLPARGFADFYLPHRYLVHDRTDERELLRSLQDGMPLGEVEKVWRGRKPVVWVVSQRLLQELQRRAGGGDEGATLVADALGLFPDPTLDTRKQALVGVRYPEGWSAARLRKPSTFDAWWRTPGHFFLSWPAPEGWGWTWSVSGTREPLRERVHPPLEAGLSDDFTLVRIGVATLTDTNPGALLDEALRRLRLVWVAHPPEASSPGGAGHGTSTNDGPRG